ncbi:MAG: cupin protein, partial [Lacunisphaera sp.]|nr:cupin protein [Lacunisphaera sp.]
HIPKGEWVQYSTPHPDGAEYMAVCLPAFAPGTVHRDE